MHFDTGLRQRRPQPAEQATNLRNNQAAQNNEQNTSSLRFFSSSTIFTSIAVATLTALSTRVLGPHPLIHSLFPGNTPLSDLESSFTRAPRVRGSLRAIPETPNVIDTTDSRRVKVLPGTLELDANSKSKLLHQIKHWLSSQSSTLHQVPLFIGESHRHDEAIATRHFIQQVISDPKAFDLGDIKINLLAEGDSLSNDQVQKYLEAAVVNCVFLEAEYNAEVDRLVKSGISEADAYSIAKGIINKADHIVNEVFDGLVNRLLTQLPNEGESTLTHGLGIKTLPLAIELTKISISLTQTGQYPSLEEKKAIILENLEAVFKLGNFLNQKTKESLASNEILRSEDELGDELYRHLERISGTFESNAEKASYISENIIVKLREKAFQRVIKASEDPTIVIVGIDHVDNLQPKELN